MFNSLEWDESKIIKEYQDEFYEIIKIDDEDVDVETKRFNFSQQLFFHNYIETTKIEIKKLETEDNKNDIAEIIDDLDILKEAIPIETKKGF